MSEYQDISLDASFQPEPGANGDILLLADARMQDIRLEAVSPQGDLFYFSEYGWGLVEFAQRPLDRLLELEIAQRVRTKLSRREDVNVSSIGVTSIVSNDGLQIDITFRFLGEDEIQQLGLLITPLEIEVIQVDK